jgi:RNA polymerase sigma-70 factor (ECF subfamily)
VVGRGKSKVEKREGFSQEALGHLDHLYRVAFHLAKEQQEARDLVQETYARALDSFEQFSPGTNMKAWLTRILYNFFLDHYHQSKRWVPLEKQSSTGEEVSDYSERVAGDDPGPEGHMLIREMHDKISEALKKIPEEFRAPIVLVDMGELSYAEASEALSCPLGTIRSRLSRGRRYLYKHLKGYIGVEVQEGRKRQK